MTNNTSFKQLWNQGLIAGLVTLSVAIIGIAELFTQRYLITNVITMGQVLIFIAPLMVAYQAAKNIDRGNTRQALQTGAVVSLVAGLPLFVLVWLTEFFDLRQFMPNVSPGMVDLVTFGQGVQVGSFIMLLVFLLVGLAAAAFYIIPDKYSNPFLKSLVVTLVIGLFSEILAIRLRDFFGTTFTGYIFRSKALLPLPALVIFGLLFYSNYRRDQIADNATDTKKRFQLQLLKDDEINWPHVGILGLALILLPFLLGTYLSEVANNVGIFILMGLGLNIVVGFAGLLDLGYVAFFAIGAYSMAVLTAQSELGIGGLNFWLALPICVAISASFGVLLGMPVLRMRGDYLAIVTLGFGEIIRILALSDLLKPFIGGAQGILQIPKPAVFGRPLLEPQYLYYVVLAGVALALFVSYRLQRSRLGRQWMAMREDEDVAEAMGINLVNTKLLAFGIGAAFSGLSGAIFAAKLTSIFPHSFNLLISINVLALIIVGGIGSLPGVAVGAAILVGLPELLREFAEYRLLMYGALLIVMMLIRPEGFVPSEVHKRELHVGDEETPVEAVAEAAAD